MPDRSAASSDATARRVSDLVWIAWLLLSRRFILRPYLSSLVELEKKEALGKLAAQVAQPHSDLRGSEKYKRHVVEVFVRRGLAQAAQMARGA